MQRILILAATLMVALSAPAMAQQSPEDAHANAVILPMLQEVSHGDGDGDVLAACIVALAEPAEKAVMVAGDDRVHPGDDGGGLTMRPMLGKAGALQTCCSGRICLAALAGAKHW